ncbi:MAG: HRDC domain-containing protein [Opitutales bacterium]|nr:HRDC domain-containing protein [Opitutales bacterium]
MAYQIFRVSAHGMGEETAALNRFLAGGKIASVRKEFVADGTNSFWSFCVETVDGVNDRVAERSKTAKVDYREVLSDADFEIFSQLRILRKSLAEKESIPAYQIFTNEQLALMVTTKVNTRAGLEKVPGVGSAKLEKYADLFLDPLRAAFGLAVT